MIWRCAQCSSGAGVIDSQAYTVAVSSSGVRSVWLRDEPETMKKRLKAESEIDSDHPCFLGSQDAYCVGTVKGRRVNWPADLRRYTRLHRVG